uniref:Uncharacterized protein n=1 Tax=Anopheles farauti TaxID=69004 RepID=A0A182Q0Z1_9DIPT
MRLYADDRDQHRGLRVREADLGGVVPEIHVRHVVERVEQKVRDGKQQVVHIGEVGEVQNTDQQCSELLRALVPGGLLLRDRRHRVAVDVRAGGGPQPVALNVQHSTAVRQRMAVHPQVLQVGQVISTLGRERLAKAARCGHPCRGQTLQHVMIVHVVLLAQHRQHLERDLILSATVLQERWQRDQRAKQPWVVEIVQVRVRAIGKSSITAPDNARPRYTIDNATVAHQHARIATGRVRTVAYRVGLLLLLLLLFATLLLRLVRGPLEIAHQQTAQAHVEEDTGQDERRATPTVLVQQHLRQGGEHERANATPAHGQARRERAPLVEVVRDDDDRGDVAQT